MRPTPITVAQLNNYIKDIVDNDEILNNVYVKGEISNLKNHYTGHIYFTLKDKTSLIKCVMFKSYTGNMNFIPKDGMSVLVFGTVSVFERDGVYQIYAKAMEQDGIGDLYAEYEKLKQKLSDEGLFDEKYKKKIPMLPKNIGVVTSKTGAVIRDIINVTTRRLPNVSIKLYPAAVQGKGAAETIVKAIESFNKKKNVDVIIIGRGGGSLEDLWPFNEEKTARAIFMSEIPIISAVGHETDFTIADFVADLRAPTPSAAGELAVPNANEIRWKIRNTNHRLSLGLTKRVSDMKTKYEYLKNNKVYREPFNKIRELTLRNDDLIKTLFSSQNIRLKDKKMKLIEYTTALDSMSPLKTLSRGYAIVEKSDGKIVNSKEILKCGDKVKITFEDGNLNAEIVK